MCVPVCVISSANGAVNVKPQTLIKGFIAHLTTKTKRSAESFTKLSPADMTKTNINVQKLILV